MATALLVLDMLNDFVDGTLANPAARPVTGPIAGLVDQARGTEGWTVIYGNDAHQPGDLEFAVFGEHAVAGSPGAEVIDPLAPAAGDLVVPKRFYSAFTQTDLATSCQTLGIDRIVLTGQHTNACARHTSYDAFTRGIDLAVVSDATCVYQPLFGEDTDAEQHRALHYLNTFYNAEVLPSNAVF